MSETCAYCGGPIDIRNPSGRCDHLCWPDNLSDKAKLANGISVGLENLVARLRSALDDLIKAAEPLLMDLHDHNWLENYADFIIAETAAGFDLGDLRSLSEAVRKAKEVK